MTITPSRRLQSLETQYFAALGQRIQSLQSGGKSILRLDIGSPDMPPAAQIVEALAGCARRPSSHGYQSHRGIPSLGMAWTEMYQRLYQVSLDPQHEVVPLLGSKEGIFHLVNALVDPGDVVLIPDPGYLTYASACRFAGGEPVYLPLLPENEYFPRLDQLDPDTISRAKILFLNYPNNPTAAVASLKFFSQCVNFCREHEILLVHDASYSQVTFDGYIAPSIFQADPDRTISIEFNTLSKSHNMAGWRSGAALGREDVLTHLFTLKTQVDSGHFLPVLEASVAALRGDQGWLVQRNLTYQKRRDAILEVVNRIGMTARPSRGSLYVWSQVPAGWKSEEFCLAVLSDAGVSLTPGTVFGPHGEGFVRICFCQDEPIIREAMQRLEKWMDR